MEGREKGEEETNPVEPLPLARTQHDNLVALQKHQRVLCLCDKVLYSDPLADSSCRRPSVAFIIKRGKHTRTLQSELHPLCRNDGVHGLYS